MYPEQSPLFNGPRSNKALVIYHADCCDGFGAAWAFMQTAATSYHTVDYVAATYGQEPPYAQCTGRDVFILDFSYPIPQLIDILEIASFTVLLDHHKTAIESLADFAYSRDRAEMLLDTGRSGAMLAWNYFSTQPAPRIITYIQDRDLWRHKELWTKEINALIAFTDKTQDAYTELHRSLERQDAFYVCTSYGEMLLKQQRRHVESIVKSTKRPFTINGHEGLICNCPGQFASDVGNVLADMTGTFGATYFAAADGSHKFSLRSVGDFDVARIAKDFGGGGHMNAAGFSIHMPLNDAGGSGVTLWNIPESAYEET